jgi:NAD(P)-dependent dehydrogenase (short-subunit alcohol dehydrogenase family)
VQGDFTKPANVEKVFEVAKKCFGAHFTRAASKEFGARGISVTALGPGPMDTPFLYSQETTDSAAYNKSAAALGSRSKTGLTDSSELVGCEWASAAAKKIAISSPAFPAID